METVILVSVLSTIGVLAVFSSIVFMFIKLKGKVDVNKLDYAIKDSYEYMETQKREFSSQINEIYNKLERDNKELENNLSSSLKNLYSHIDSRCDKLDSKINK